jgi:hypothetical protein
MLCHSGKNRNPAVFCQMKTATDLIPAGGYCIRSDTAYAGRMQRHRFSEDAAATRHFNLDDTVISAYSELRFHRSDRISGFDSGPNPLTPLCKGVLHTPGGRFPDGCMRNTPLRQET